MKICANFTLLPSIGLKENAGSDRSWVWQCADFSEEKAEMSVLAIRFATSENALKFLKHNKTGEMRCLMRREKTMKICANFTLLPSIGLKENAGSDRSWVWQCADFSEEKAEMSVLAIRFATSE